MFDLDTLKKLLSDKGASVLLYKQLSENDNSKNQIYLGNSYEAIQILPYNDIKSYSDCKIPNFKASIDLWWINDSGLLAPAPNAQLILYPKYPEVRLSGFLSGCSIAPSSYLQAPKKIERKGNKDGRILLLAPIGRSIFAYLAPPNSPISTILMDQQSDGVFGRIPLGGDSRQALIHRLRAVYNDNPHEFVRMFTDGSIRPYKAKNAAGYTLEAKFGIIPNGNAEPDYRGWELKCFSGSTVTLMTPEPDGGEYAEMGVREFVIQYGHVSPDGGRYFTGPYSSTANNKFDCIRHIFVNGYDVKQKQITDVQGSVQLVQDGYEIASWSFAHLLKHWNKKHEKACYVKYSKTEDSLIRFKPTVQLCTITSPNFLLDSLCSGIVYYDPGSRINIDGKLKARSQFRVKEKNIPCLYQSSELIDLSSFHT